MAGRSPMTSFLFWNVMKKDLGPLVGAAGLERDADIILLAEAGAKDIDTVQALKAQTGQNYFALSEEFDKVRIYSRIPPDRWRRRQTDGLSARMAIWSVAVGNHPGILLAAAHFISKNNKSSAEQAMLAVELSKEILRVEETVGHERTVVVGDLNMNPFDPGVTGAPALHAVMTRKLAGRTERTVEGRPYRFFYNPMWGFFGDRTAGPPGTYYHRAASIGDIFWHMLDQVLLRPALMDRVHDLAILERIDGGELLTDPGGLPHNEDCSDHLPLAFRLDLA